MMRTPAYANNGVTIFQGDVRDVLREMPSRSVHTCVTSPPYYCLRSYGVEGQIGLEATPQAHICALLEVFAEVWRVLRDDGTLWLNYGDSYAGSTQGGGNKPNRVGGGSKRLLELHRTQSFVSVGVPCGFKSKDLLLMPTRIAIALQDAGWYVRSEIVWAKRAPMPESVTDRPTCAHEKIFLLTKRANYFYDADAISEKAEQPIGIPKWTAQHKQTQLRGFQGGSTLGTNQGGSRRNMRNVWTLSPSAFPDAHFATFPPELPKRCILAGSSEKGCCPKCGKGWVRVVETIGGTGKSWHDHSLDATDGHQKDEKEAMGANFYKNYKRNELGWQPSCKCEGVTDADLQPATILDPFLGAGTTALVAKTLGRKAIGIELSPEYVKMSVRRLAQGCLELR